jgi:glycosyltransferase involved in cell wall biosynthesis
MSNPPEVTIVVPTRNESHNLPRLLRSINMQRDVSFEIIVVDQESDDGTQDLAREAGATVLDRARPAFYTPPSQSRNAGAQIARASVLLHLDADMELPDPNFLSRFMALFDDGHEAAIIHETDVAQGWWNKVKAAERACYWNTGIECARGVTKRLFDEIGGYDPAISSGEDMHIQRLYTQRTTVARSNDVWLKHHTGRLPLKRLIVKKYSYGKTASAFLQQSAQADGYSARGWMKEALVAYATHPRVALRNPLVFACILPLRVAELVAVKLGMRVASKTAHSAEAPAPSR